MVVWPTSWGSQGYLQHNYRPQPPSTPPFHFNPHQPPSYAAQNHQNRHQPAQYPPHVHSSQPVYQPYAPSAPIHTHNSDVPRHLPPPPNHPTQSPHAPPHLHPVNQPTPTPPPAPAAPLAPSSTASLASPTASCSLSEAIHMHASLNQQRRQLATTASSCNLPPATASAPTGGTDGSIAGTGSLHAPMREAGDTAVYEGGHWQMCASQACQPDPDPIPITPICHHVLHSKPNPHRKIRASQACQPTPTSAPHPKIRAWQAHQQHSSGQGISSTLTPQQHPAGQADPIVTAAQALLLLGTTWRPR